MTRDQFDLIWESKIANRWKFADVDAELLYGKVQIAAITCLTAAVDDIALELGTRRPTLLDIANTTRRLNSETKNMTVHTTCRYCHGTGNLIFAAKRGPRGEMLAHTVCDTLLMPKGGGETGYYTFAITCDCENAPYVDDLNGVRRATKAMPTDCWGDGPDEPASDESWATMTAAIKNLGSCKAVPNTRNNASNERLRQRQDLAAAVVHEEEPEF